MTTARLFGFIWMLTGSAIFVLWGSSMERNSPLGMCDFQTVYNHARVLIEHGDPYIESEAPYIRMKSEGYLDPRSSSVIGLPLIPCVYPPTSLVVASPLALLRWRQARITWMILTSCGLVLAGFLMWEIAALYAPLLSGALIGFLLANSATLLFEGNAAGVAVSLCVIAVWCFLRDRFALLGVACMAVSLAIKPHDAGLVWLYFMLVGGIFRKRAIQTLMVTVVLSLLSILWVSQWSPNWRQELSSNISAVSGRGQVNNPGPSSATHLITNSAIDAQTIFSTLRDDQYFYASLSYLLCGSLLLIWVLTTRKLPFSYANSLLALATISALSMLPVYHRHHDAKLLLLSVPACAMLWAETRIAGRIVLAGTVAAFAMNGDIPRAILARLEANLTFSTSSMSGKMFIVAVARPAPLALLAMTVLYLWIYVMRTSRQQGTPDAASICSQISPMHDSTPVNTSHPPLLRMSGALGKGRDRL